MTAFFLCRQGGIVERSSDDASTAGSPLVAFFARDSRTKVMQLLVDARESPAHSVVQTQDGAVLEAYCACDETRALVITGRSVVDIRRWCDELAGSETTAALARAIGEATKPSELTFDLWDELARVNNELATAHRDLAKSNAQLRWLSEQKNQLLGMAAHDLRNPLAVVLAYTKFVLEDEERLSPEQAEMMARIRANAEAMLSIVEDVVDFTAIESGTVHLETAPFDVAGLVREVVEVCRIIASRKQIEIEADIERDLPEIVADRRKIAQVLTNLVTNAIKYSPAGERIRVIAAKAADGTVRISVTDHGAGMSAIQVQRLFRPFQRVGTKPTAGEKSTGLGLAIVSRIVDAHHGRIEVESTPGKGSTFTVLLASAAAVREERTAPSS